MRKHWRIIVLGVLVSGAAIYMIASQIDFELLLEALRQANYPILIPVLVLITLGLAARGQRWRILLGGALPYWRAFHIINITYLVNGLLPLRAGEVARVWLASRGSPTGDDVPILKSAGTIVVERLLDLLVVVSFIGLGLAMAGDDVPEGLRITGTFTGAVAFVGFFVAIFLSSRRAIPQGVLAFFVNRVVFLQRFDLSEWLDHLLDGFAPLSRPVTLFNSLLWTAISWGFSLVAGYVTMLVFYPEGDVVVTLLFIAAASFAVAFPAVPGNVGPYEASILFAMSAFGYLDTPEGLATATAFAIAVHFSNLLMNAILGVIGFVAEGVTLEQLQTQVAKMREEQETI